MTLSSFLIFILEFTKFYLFMATSNSGGMFTQSFKEATQEEGHNRTTLGHWEKFDESYKVMLFTNGDKCWNGPNRSLTVRLRCGSKVEVADIDEPSRCEYSALLTTPALCQEGRLKELQDKLETVNKKQQQGHDEL